MLHPNPAVNRLLWLLQAVLLAGAALAFYKVLFRPLLPLGVAFLLSCLIAGPADRLCRRSRLSRGVCALLLTAAVIAALCLGGWLLGRLAAGQLKQLMGALPDLLYGLEEALSALQQRLERRFPGRNPLPQVLSPETWLDALTVPEIDLQSLAGSLGWAASSLPNLLLTAVFTLAATVMCVSYRGEILGFVRRQLPPRLLEAARKLRVYLRDALLGWCKAQGILAAVTFGVLLAGFFLLRVQGAGLLAFVIALMDALPVLGTGLVLVPWALAELLLGQYGRAAGLALLYAASAVLRNALEPHVVGRQIGLHPFVSLVSFYLGWRLAGIWGMLLFPIAALILVKLQEWGYSSWWR